MCAAHYDRNLYFGPRVEMRRDLTPLSDLIAAIAGPILFLGIGAPDATGDSYGPRITMLLERAGVARFGCTVVGTMSNPAHAYTLAGKIEESRSKYPDYTWIAMDSCVGKPSQVGVTCIAEGMMVAGTGVGKFLPPVGDYVLAAVVARFHRNSKRTCSQLRFEVDEDFMDDLSSQAARAILIGLQRRMRANRSTKQQPATR